MHKNPPPPPIKRRPRKTKSRRRQRRFHKVKHNKGENQIIYKASRFRRLATLAPAYVGRKQLLAEPAVGHAWQYNVSTDDSKIQRRSHRENQELTKFRYRPASSLPDFACALRYFMRVCPICRCNKKATRVCKRRRQLPGRRCCTPS